MRSLNLAPGRNRKQESARNRCCRCGYEWRDRPFGHARYDSCPKCGSAYWEWLDELPYRAQLLET